MRVCMPTLLLVHPCSLERARVCRLKPARSGTIRANLDPFGQYDDSALLSALEAVQLASFVAERGGLDGKLTDDGGNASIGQRQLLCLARAVLRGSKIFIMYSSPPPPVAEPAFALP